MAKNPNHVARRIEKAKKKRDLDAWREFRDNEIKAAYHAPREDGDVTDLSRHDKMAAAAVWLAGQGAFVGWGATTDGKAVKRKWKSDMTRDEVAIRQMLHGARNSVIVPAGRLVVIDVDKHGWYERLLNQGLPPTFTVVTPTTRKEADSQPLRPEDDQSQPTYHGKQVYGLAPDGYDVTDIPTNWGGGETRRSVNGDHDMVLGPWALRADGIYTPVEGTPRSLAVIPLPVLDWLGAHPREGGGGTEQPPKDDNGDWQWDPAMGSRHDHLLGKIRFWRGKAITGQPLRDMAHAYVARHGIPMTSRANGEPALDDDEIERMCTGAETKFGDDPPDITLRLNTTTPTTPTSSTPPNLPEDFWTALPCLAAIRQAAWSRSVSPDGVLAPILARAAASLDHRLGLPAIVGSQVGLSLEVASVAPSGFGKSSGDGIADELFPLRPEVVQITGGSGEGMSESFFAVEKIAGPDGKVKPTKVLKHHNLYGFVDEGSKTNALAARNGATLYPTWRSMFTGGAIGEANASADTRRQVPKGQYAVGLLAAFQPAVLGDLFADLPNGTPQRFLYLSATDPSIPDIPPKWPRWTAPVLDLAHAHDVVRSGRLGTAWPYEMRIAPAVTTEIRDAAVRRSRGQAAADDWGAHRNLLRLKVAALLVILDRGDTSLLVTEEDWALAGMVVDTSDAVRAHAQSVIDAASGRAEAVSANRAANRAVLTHARVEDSTIERLARRITRLVVAKSGQFTPGAAKRELESTVCHLGDDAIEFAVGKGWLRVETEPSHTGTDKERLHKGPVAMPK